MPDRHEVTTMTIVLPPGRPLGWVGAASPKRSWIHDGERWTRPDTVTHEFDTPRRWTLTLNRRADQPAYVFSNGFTRHDRAHSTVYTATCRRIR
jgi:hypothetical protein